MQYFQSMKDVALAARYYVFFRRSQRWSRKDLQEYQNAKLRELVRHAGEHVPYYRDLFKEIGLDPLTFRGREDISRIPLLDKETVRTRQREFVADNAERFGVNSDSTSGSTGTPLELVIDNGAKYSKLAALLRCYQWAGYSFGKKTFSLTSYHFADKSFEYKKLFRVFRFDSNKLGKKSALEAVGILNAVKPRFYMGYPFPLVMLANFAAEEGLKIHSPDSMVTYGETLSRGRRERLEAGYGARVFDFYSLHECAAMISDCEFGTRHWMDDFAYNEIVDDQGEDAFESGTGELVGTGLFNYAMPLIRYKIRDQVQVDNTGRICQCGRNLGVVEEIIGRQNDFIQTPDGRFLGNVLEHSMDKARGVISSQVVQDSVDHLYVNLVIDESFTDQSVRAIESGLRKRVGEKMRIDFKRVPELERNKAGKTPFMISKIGHAFE